MGPETGTRPIKRRFLVLVHRVPIDAEFSLNDLAGTGGRMDAIASVVTSAFLLSNNMRRDTDLTLLIVTDKERTLSLRLDGRRLKYLNPDERSTAALVKNSITRYWGSEAVRMKELPEGTELETSPGIFVKASEEAMELKGFASSGKAFWLSEDGEPMAFPTGEDGFSVIMSDPYEPSEDERNILSSLGLKKVSIGPLSVHTAHCISVVHNRFDNAKPYQNRMPSENESA